MCVFSSILVNKDDQNCVNFFVSKNVGKMLIGAFLFKNKNVINVYNSVRTDTAVLLDTAF